MNLNCLHLHPLDNIAIAKTTLLPGMEAFVSLQSGGDLRLPVRQPVPPGHKVALERLAAGDAVRRYGQVIGLAAGEILPGAHIHSHNLAFSLSEPLITSPSPDSPPEERREAEPHTFQGEERAFLGYGRPDGRVGTRNYVAVIASVNCSAHVCRRIAAHFTAERLAEYPNVDGVIALTHHGGCAASDYSHLQRTLAGMAGHPNVGAYITVGLGCEGNQLSELARDFGLADPDLPLHPGQPGALNIQQSGGAAATIQAGIAAVEALLARANNVQRTPQPLSKLTLALECGGSDSWSGISANPLVGMAADAVVRQGGTIVLSETPEIYGAQHLLVERAVSPAVARALLAKVDWWRDYLQRMGGDFEANPSPGNRAGGLSNICEKSLGAIAKSGATPLTAVYDYAEQIDQTGFVFMDSTGYDPASVTGMVAGGCNLVLFTTGRGSVFGFKPAPVIKICTNSHTFQQMSADMDFNAGAIVDGDMDFQSGRAALMDQIIAVASGQPSKSEAQGMGEVEFMPWMPYGVV